MIPHTLKCRTCGCVYVQTCTDATIVKRPGEWFSFLSSWRKLRQKSPDDFLGKIKYHPPGKCPHCGKSGEGVPLPGGL